MRVRLVEFSVGVLVVLGGLAFAILTLNVSGASNLFHTTEGYAINIEFDNIGGLKVRSKVAIAGVSIGRVTNIELDPVTYNARVTVKINKVNNNIPTDSRATIMTAGLLGDNYIGISPGFENSYLRDNDSISAENTDSAVILEELISKFVTKEAGSK